MHQDGQDGEGQSVLRENDWGEAQDLSPSLGQGENVAMQTLNCVIEFAATRV